MSSPLFRQVIANILLILLPGLALAQSDGAVCLDHEELINVDVNSLAFDMACDDIAIAYISGATGIAPIYNRESLLEDYSYYLLTRVFLNSENFPDEFLSKTQRFSPLLITILDMLGSQEFEGIPDQQLGEERRKIYTTFVLYQFFSIEGLPDDYADLFQLKIASVIFPMRLTGRQMECFIISDIPTLPVSKVFASNSYSQCLGNDA